MKPGIVTTILCVVISLNLTAQNPGQIIIGKEYKKTTYQQNGKYLTQEELAEVLKSYPGSAREYQVSSSIGKIGMAFVAPGILLGGTGGLFNVSYATHSEWTVLITYLGSAAIAGGKLKEAGLEHWNSPNTGAENSVGFSAVPAGVRGHDGASNVSIILSVANAVGCDINN